MHGQSPGQGDALGLPAGQLPGLFPGVVGEADPAEPVGGLPAGAAPVDAVAAGAEGDVVQRGQVRK